MMTKQDWKRYGELFLKWQAGTITPAERDWLKQHRHAEEATFKMIQPAPKKKEQP